MGPRPWCPAWIRHCLVLFSCSFYGKIGQIKGLRRPLQHSRPSSQFGILPPGIDLPMPGEASGRSRIIQEIFANSRGGCPNLLFNSVLLLSATYFHKRHIFSHSVYRADTPPARHLPGQTPLLGRHPTRQTPSGQTPLGGHPPGQTPSWADTSGQKVTAADGTDPIGILSCLP